MKALSTFSKRIVFLLVCVLSWGLLPILMLTGGLALLIYAVIEELVDSLLGAKDAPLDPPPRVGWPRPLKASLASTRERLPRLRKPIPTPGPPAHGCCAAMPRASVLAWQIAQGVRHGKPEFLGC